MDESKENEERMHTDTEVLQEIAAEAERDRASRGHSEFEAPEEPEERLMSDAAAFSDENPDVDADTREDHEHGVPPVMVVSENGGGTVLPEVPGEPLR